ncbi:MAG: DUF167 domain-containing protein [Armatimonadota bacterium]
MVRLEVKVTPRAKKNEVVGWHQDHILVVKIAAPPIGGQANDELCRYLAERLGIAPSDILIVRGYTSRQKALEISGVTEQEVKHRLQPG